ncbi:hypothetical protein NBRC10512_004729 [Rhodotorula toruloides]|uniref:RHTO0S03e00166g1_1 n=2 Tax=Rhodotorula toruloides TaxID=5286 RepID=A0A061ASY6_RHOTO|nr:nitrilase/cyanide hydratase and apolipoprotein N-acyltransferase [Rhodotorula toruloides NP11]EMS25616.1 nitrilase/cyanide hydratase and apolipoprotein N-acyltransferase [Rhodotorula toruloides NP11]KAJ8296160.1 hypothetical protein OF846_001464 [Rhodotorula toruloides]CDR37834.1 RHTO0S03e00166g1_1 [Rhodotorula toruloides]
MLKPFVVAAAQLSVSPFPSVADNLATHLHFVRLAAENDVQLLVFPELSVTGYSLKLSKEAIFTVDDARLDELHGACQETGVTACVGVPMLADTIDGTHIASIVLHPGGSRHAHTKRFLDSSEIASFVPRTGGPLLDFPSASEHTERVALAICADTSCPLHPLSASQAGATVYAAGSIISSASYGAESARLASYAKHYGMAVLLANHADGRGTGGYETKGGSAVWDEEGKVVVRAENGEGEVLVVARKSAERGWAGEVIALS